MAALRLQYQAHIAAILNSKCSTRKPGQAGVLTLEIGLRVHTLRRRRCDESSTEDNREKAASDLLHRHRAAAMDYGTA